MMILGFLVFVVVLTLLVKAGSHIMGKRASHVIEERHREAEFIVETGRPPPTWATDDKLTNLNHLMAYFQTSRLVDNEPTRELLLNSLRQVRDTWEIEHDS